MGSLNCFSQINRTVWGCTLGKSTKQQVRSALVQKGYDVVVEPDGSLASSFYNVPFGGAYWSYVSFSFVNGFLSEICFLTDEVRSAVNIDNSLDKLTSSLDSKYKRYKQAPSNINKKSSCYTDDITFVELMILNNNGKRVYTLLYTDIELSMKEDQNNVDEL